MGFFESDAIKVLKDDCKLLVCPKYRIQLSILMKMSDEFTESLSLTGKNQWVGWGADNLVKHHQEEVKLWE